MMEKHPDAVILCGGKSSRFGEDKARVMHDGSPQLITLSKQLASAGHDVHYVADRQDRYHDLHINCWCDAEGVAGPLAGLTAALQHVKSLHATKENEAWLLLVSCDQWCWFDSWSKQLSISAQQNPNAKAILFQDAQMQPLPALYHSSLLPVCQQQILANEFSLKRLLERLGDAVHFASVDAMQSPARWTFNTRDEWHRLQG